MMPLKEKTTENEVEKNAAKLLYKNKIIGRYVGKAEFGARALGNRSILANTKNNDIKKKINEKIKSRDFWMPFAASVPEKYAKKYVGDMNWKMVLYIFSAYTTGCLTASLMMPYIILEKMNKRLRGLCLLDLWWLGDVSTLLPFLTKMWF